jgi:hypothetical protein
VARNAPVKQIPLGLYSERGARRPLSLVLLLSVLTREGPSGPEGKVLTFDGVAIVRRGDALLICYQKSASLQRTRWLFDVLDRAALLLPKGFLGFLLVLDTSDPPDGPTREENTNRLASLGPALRRMVTVPVGDALRTAIVRTMMRALNLALGHSKQRIVASTVDEGVTRLLEAASPKTPSRRQLKLDLDALYVALGVPVVAVDRSVGGEETVQRGGPP